MIDFGDFHFSTAPGTGANWFLRAAGSAGLSIRCAPPEDGNVYVPFQSRQENKLKVSLVRHPCDWLAHVYTKSLDGVWFPPAPFYTFRLFTFSDYVYDYLRLARRGIGRLYHAYQADTVMRIEDMPLAFFELLHSVGSDIECLKEGRIRRPVPIITPPDWDPSLRKRVGEAERETMERYDYYV